MGYEKKILQLINEDRLEFDKLPEKYKKDKEIFLQAVKKHGYALKYADESLTKDKTIVLEAINNCSYGLKFADKSLNEKFQKGSFYCPFFLSKLKIFNEVFNEPLRRFLKVSPF